MLFTICIILFFIWIAVIILVQISNKKWDEALLQKVELQRQESEEIGSRIRNRFQKTAEGLDELNEQMEETNVRMSETNIRMKEVSKRIGERSEQMGILIKQLGEVIERESQSQVQDELINDMLSNYGISVSEEEIEKARSPEEFKCHEIDYRGKSIFDILPVVLSIIKEIEKTELKDTIGLEITIKHKKVSEYIQSVKKGLILSPLEKEN